jgi:hypothetical protein
MNYCKGGCGHKLVTGSDYCGGPKSVRCACGGNAPKKCTFTESEPHTIAPADKRSWLDLYRELGSVCGRREELIRELAGANSDFDKVRLQLDSLLHFLRNEAPHMSNCRYMWGEPCNCWKSKSPFPIIKQAGREIPVVLDQSGWPGCGLHRYHRHNDKEAL